eukprot:394976_1
MTQQNSVEDQNINNRYGSDHQGSIGISSTFRNNPLTIVSNETSKQSILLPVPNPHVIGLDNDEVNDYDSNKIRNTNIKNELMISGEPIILNIGGTKYQTTLTTLSRYPNSVLFKMFEGKFSLKPNKDGSYFIDRNGKYFDLILDYMRTGKLIIPDQNQKYLLNHLLSESEFYQIMPLISDVSIMKISLMSNILSVNHIKQIQQWINNKPNPLMDYKWTLLYQFNYQYKCDSASKYNCSVLNILRTIEHRESVLLIFTKHNRACAVYPSMIGIFIEDKINTFKNGSHFKFCMNEPNGFCFRMSQTSAEKYKIQMLKANNGPYGCGGKLQCTNSVEPVSIQGLEVEKFEIFCI